MNPTVYAIAKADLLLRVADPSCCEDGYDGKRFRLMLANPPFGVETGRAHYPQPRPRQF
jgi:type I restriction-modification system DNA methylase subunit